jgi:acetyl esterase
VAIDPAIAALMQQIPQPAPSASEGIPVATRRDSIEAGFSALMAGLPPGPVFDDVDISETTVAGPERDIPVRIFRPSGATGELPAVLYFFGGAWWMRSYNSPDIIRACRQIASEANAVVVEIDYALAPEHPYPAAVDEGSAVLDWMASGRTGFGIDSSRLAVGGQSSGGGIAASLALKTRDQGGPNISLQVLEVPATDLSTARFHPPLADGVTGEQVAGMLEAVNFYLPDGIPAGDHVASPAAAENFGGLPPTLIVTAENDIIGPLGQEYADKLRLAGVDVVSVVYGGQVHASPALSGLSVGARAWRRQVSWAVGTLHSITGPLS